MNLQDDPEAVFRTVMPESPPPTSELDLDRIVRDGYRARRRHRAVLGGAATTGVAAVAGVLAITVVGLPGGTTDPTEDPTGGDTAPPAAEETIDDPSMAGYPYREDWGLADGGGEYAEYEPSAEVLTVQDAATAAFGQLLADNGVWNDPENTPDEEECSYLAEEGATQEEIDQCMAEASGMHVSADQEPGNYSQTYLRTIVGGESEEDGSALRSIFELKVLLPGGWTAEPGPITQQLFPQHLISDGPYFSEEAPEFTSEELDDGRTLMIADHGCAADIAVVYPNGTGLRTSWNNCSGTDYPLDLEGLKTAALAMPEFEFDTSELTPVGDLIDVPTGWIDEYDVWANSPEAEEQARQSYDGAREALQNLYPEATLGTGDARSLGITGRGLVIQRSYGNSGTLPFETTVDETTADVYFDLRYYLPGGWIPGYSETGHWDPHLRVCGEEYACSTMTDDDGTIWTFEELNVEYQPQAGEDWEPYTDHEIYATRYSPEGWAVGMWVSWQDDAPIDADMLGDILRDMPAPVYDEDAVPEVPAG
ncbi:hypothetical protein [Glycomyces sp. NPDC048151]|uniref:hypothetical protein n=1 Tax=Glycomyces sp. NPDC048151 TaxID=3364002 RepID=UPI00371833AE